MVPVEMSTAYNERVAEFLSTPDTVVAVGINGVRNNTQNSLHVQAGAVGLDHD